VQVTTHLGANSCEETTVDGYKGPITTKDRCNIPMMGDLGPGVEILQHVKIDDKTAWWTHEVVGPPFFKFATRNTDFSTTLDLKTGMLRYADLNNHRRVFRCDLR
jgi:hypothetical protein